jgi:ubiquinol-cytochrome c reductase iron-sulfur subunit
MDKDYTSEAQKKKTISRRDFLKLLTAAGTIVAFTPFIDWGKFMPSVRGSETPRQKVILHDGTQANVNTFPVDHKEVIIYPLTGDRVLDQDALRTWQLIRLPANLGGDKTAVSAFRAYSMVCLHLWCLWNYSPVTRDGKTGKLVGGKGFCPCHGSEYDPSTGKATAGPASFQSPPSNVLPRLDLEIDSNGYLWITPPKWDVNANGIIGFGRFLKA